MNTMRIPLLFLLFASSVFALDWANALNGVSDLAKQKAMDSADRLMDSTLKLKEEDSEAKRALSPEQQRRAQEARLLFANPPSAKPHRGKVYDRRNDKEWRLLLAHFHDVLGKYRGLDQISPEELAELAEAIMPFLRYVFPPGEGESHLDGLALELGPGETAKLLLKGLCLDLGKPAPRGGELLQLVSIEPLIPEELQVLYKALLQYWAIHRNEHSGVIQNLLWGMRHGGTRGPPITRLSEGQRRVLDAALPGGADLYQRYLDKLAAKRRLKEFGSAFLKALAQTISKELGEHMPVPKGDGFSLSETETILGQLARLQVEGEPSEGSEYGLLQAGVAVRTVCVGSLTPVCIEIINTTGESFVYDLALVVGQSCRVTQRVALAGLNDGGAALANRYLEVLRMLELEPLKEFQRLLQTAITAYGSRPNATEVEKAAALVAGALNEFLMPVSLLDVIPLAGSAAKLGKALSKGLPRLRVLDKGLSEIEKLSAKGVRAAERTTQRVFWSGGRAAEDAARTFATGNGGVIIGDTAAGRALAEATEGVPWSKVRPQWLDLSKAFARGASGEVNVFQNARGLSLDSIWREEFKILLNNPDVTKINFHVVMPNGSIFIH